MKSLAKFVLGAALACVWSVPAFAGLDIYAGPLGKFYQNDYLSTQAQTAQELGVEFQTVYPNGEPKWLTEKNVEKKLKEFRQTVSSESSDMGSWSEDTDSYLIEQIYWEALAALIHVSAFAIRDDLERSKEFSGDYEEYAAYSESFDKGYYIGPLAVLESDLFLPSEKSTVVLGEDPLGDEIMITTTHNLKNTLAYLNREIWDGEARPELWFDRGVAKVGLTTELIVSEETGELEMQEVNYPSMEDVALHNAEYAYGVLVKLLAYSEKHNVPIAMDG